MSCGVCGRQAVAGSCNDGFVAYLSGDYPCVFNKKADGPRNLRELPPLNHRAPEVRLSSEGLEDLL